MTKETEELTTLLLAWAKKWKYELHTMNDGEEVDFININIARNEMYFDHYDIKEYLWKE